MCERIRAVPVHYLHLPQIQVARDVDFGAVRLIPGDTFRSAVRDAHTRRPVSPKLQWYADRVDEQVSSWAGMPFWQSKQPTRSRQQR